MSTKAVHTLSLEGFGKGKSEQYDAARPRYDPNILVHIRTLISKPGDINVAEIGCGSGIFTRALLSHPDWETSLGALRAIDPNEGMRNTFASTIKDPRVTLTDGTFDNTGVDGGWADAILIVTAFHWCLDFEAALQEFARILKPEGVVVVVYALSPDKESTPHVKELSDLMASYDPRMKNAKRPGHPHEHWRDVFDAPSYPKLFDPPHEETVLLTIRTTVEKIEAYMLTVSYFAILPDEEKEIVKQRIRDILENGESVVWVDKEQGLLESPQRTLAVSFRKKN